MVTEKQFRTYARRMDTVGRSTKSAVAKLWTKLDASSMDALGTSLMRYLPGIAMKMGQVAALASADYYEEAMPEMDGYTVTTYGGSSLWKIERDVTWALEQQLYANVLEDPIAMQSLMSFMSGTMDGVVKSYGRDTVEGNATDDKWCSGYTSVTSPDCGCSFCMMKSLESYSNFMGERLGHEVDGNAWHDNCNCQLLPVFGELPSWAAGQYQSAKTLYDAGVEYASDGDPMATLSAKDVMAGMRAASGGYLTH